MDRLGALSGVPLHKAAIFPLEMDSLFALSRDPLLWWAFATRINRWRLLCGACDFDSRFHYGRKRFSVPRLGVSDFSVSLFSPPGMGRFCLLVGGFQSFVTHLYGDGPFVSNGWAQHEFTMPVVIWDK